MHNVEKLAGGTSTSASRQNVFGASISRLLKHVKPFFTIMHERVNLVHIT